MANEPDRNNGNYWNQPAEPGGLPPSLEPARTRTTGLAPKRRSGRERPSISPPIDASLDDEAFISSRISDEDGIHRVGGRRRFRPELAVIALGAIFLAGALIKPWPSPPPGHSAAPIVTANGSAALVALDTPDIQIGIPGDVAQGWSTVNWGLLSGTDRHPGWGLAVAVMPSLTDGLVAPEKASPSATWVEAGSTPSFATLRITRGLSPYAIAVTWPSSLKVTGVTFQYLNGPDYPINVRPPGFPEFAQVTPVPADVVASPADPPAESSPAAAAASIAPPSVGPSPATSFGPPASEKAAAGSVLESGRFWIPPTDASLSTVSAAASTADWQTLPWPWPIGNYWVRINSASGTTMILFQIEEG